MRRHPGQHHAATSPRGPQGHVERARRADRVDRHVDPAQQVLLVQPGRQARQPGLHREGLREPAHPAHRLGRLDDVGRAERPGQRRLRAVLGHHHDPTGRGQPADRQGGEQPHRARAGHQDGLALGDPGPLGEPHGARQWFHEHGAGVAQRVRDRVELRAVGDQALAPATAGRGAVAGLQTGPQVADAHPVAAVGVPGGALLARLEPPGGAGQHGVDDDTGPGRQVVAVLRQGADDLVARHARLGGDAREVQRRGAGHRAQVGAADAGQVHLDLGPAGVPDHRLVAGGQPDRREGADQQAGDASRRGDRPGGRVPGDRAEQLQRQHHGRHPTARARAGRTRARLTPRAAVRAGARSGRPRSRRTRRGGRRG